MWVKEPKVLGFGDTFKEDSTKMVRGGTGEEVGGEKKKTSGDRRVAS